jgi:phosphoribosylaminoimidazole-succinocarboxamide synthase
MKGVTSIELPVVPLLISGKVREVFDLGTEALIVATDRISAFDCILPDPIPGKGKVLTQLSAFWFEKFHDVPSHFITANVDEFPAILKPYSDLLRDRSMIVRKTNPLPVECVVRGYLAGSGWKEYQKTKTVCGIKLPAGLELASQLPTHLFTPAAKARSGHDENITWEKCCAMVGEPAAIKIRDFSLAIYGDGSIHAAEEGIIIADSKFEFGLLGEEIILIDECLTPDSSRFWPADEYAAGANPPSFDKQFVRDYLETLTWNKRPPAPSLPPEVIEKTSLKYQEAFDRLLGRVA